MFTFASHAPALDLRHCRIGASFTWMLLPVVVSACALVATLYAGVRPYLGAVPASTLREAVWIAAGVLGAGVLASGAVAWFVWRNMLYPLCRLTVAVTRSADPGPPLPAEVCGPYEIAMLAQRFNRTLAEQARKNTQLRLAASVFDAASEGILIVSARLRIVEANRAFLRMSGYARDELIGRNPRILQSGRQDAPFYMAMWQSLRTNGHWRGQIWDRRRDGSLFAALLTISAVRGPDGATGHYVALFADITELRRRQDEMERLAYVDPLTGLSNRRVLRERLQAALAQAGAGGTVAAVCTIDLDEFKAVNDRCGHDAGDAVLVAVAGRLTQAVRACDTVVRTGGDEFVIVLPGLVDETEAYDIMRRARDALVEPVALPGGNAQVGASIGLACYPRDGRDGPALLCKSDAAMYRAKALGRNRIVGAGGHGC